MSLCIVVATYPAYQADGGHEEFLKGREAAVSNDSI